MNRNPVIRTSRPDDHLSPSPSLLSILLLLPLMIPIGCEGEGSAEQDIGSGEVLAHSSFPAQATSAQRFGFSNTRASAATATQDHGPDYLYDKPESWIELAPSQFRLINFQVAGDERTACYLTVLSGDGGGLAANVNRWRTQMKLEPLDAATLAALPKGQLLGNEATFFDATGTFEGMDGSQASEGSRMIGLLAFTDTRSLFLKMVGPTSVVDAEEGAFQALARSLEDAHAGHNHGAAPTASAAPAPRTPAAAPMTTGSGISWDIPAGWQVTAPRPMRLVNFDLGGEGDNQCYISILGGDGGGTLANVNRWRQQMGQAGLGIGDLETMERIPMLDGTALMVEIEGSFQGMGSDAQSEALMLGAIRELDDRTVYVKMIGGRGELALKRDSFLEFCQSIRFASGS